jgi:hypothetical protein
MEVWTRLTSEPAKLRTALRARNRRRLAAVAHRLTVALATLDDRARATNGSKSAPPRERYARPAEIAPEYGVHPRTLQRWLADDLPDALFKRRRLTLVDLDRYAEWKTRFSRKHAAG